MSKQHCHHYKTIQTYFLSCKNHADNIGSKKVTMTKKIIREASRCANCIADESRLIKKINSLIKSLIKKSGWDKINPKFFHILNISHYKICCHIVSSAKKIRKK